LAIQSVEDCKNEIASLEQQLRFLTAKTPRLPRKKKGDTETKTLTPANQAIRKDILAEKRTVRKQQTATRAKQSQLLGSLQSIQAEIRARRAEMYIQSLPIELRSFNTVVPPFPVYPAPRKFLVIAGGFPRILTSEEVKIGYLGAFATVRAALANPLPGDQIYIESGVFALPPTFHWSDDEDQDNATIDLNSHIEFIGLGEDCSSVLAHQSDMQLFLNVTRCCVKFTNISFIQSDDAGDPDEDPVFICVKDIGSLWLLNCQIDFMLAGFISVEEGSNLFVQKTTFKNSEDSAIIIQTSADSVVLEDCHVSNCGHEADSSAVSVIRPPYWRNPNPHAPATVHITIRRTTIENNGGHPFGIRESRLFFHNNWNHIFEPLRTGKTLLLEDNTFRDNRGCFPDLCEPTKICLGREPEDSSSDEGIMHPFYDGMGGGYYSDSDSASEEDYGGAYHRHLMYDQPALCTMM